MNSPLGKYSQLVAAITAVSIIAAWIVAVFAEAFGVVVQVAGLKEVALIALGAVFGSAATVNGVKAPLDAAHNRIDKLEEATGIPTHGSYIQGVQGPVGPVGPEGPRGETGAIGGTPNAG